MFFPISRKKCIYRAEISALIYGFRKGKSLYGNE